MFLLNIAQGAETVDAAGTAQPVVTSETWAYSVTFQAFTGNTGSVFIGTSDVDSSSGIELTGGDTWTYEPAANRNGSATPFDLSQFYIDAANNDDGVSFVYTVDGRQNNFS